MGLMQRKFAGRKRGRRGFALVACLTVMVLLSVLTLGMLSLSAVQLRLSGSAADVARARANAELALMLAIGQLQRELGPDTRVSATAELLDEAGSVRQPHWTGAWSTRMEDGGPPLVRDDRQGGWKDRRSGDRERAWRKPAGWLVSGVRPDPGQEPPAGAIELVGGGTLGGSSPEGRVFAPSLAIGATAAGETGRIAWWTGDLGVKANVATPDAHEGQEPDPGNPGGGGWFRLLASQEADTRLLPGAPDLTAKAKGRLASDGTARHAWPAGDPAPLFHDLTVHSEGVLANVAEGGLKRDLTAYFQSDGMIEGWKGLPGLADDDRLVGPANEAAAARAGIDWGATRHRQSSPRFGLLRQWANSGAVFGTGAVPAVPPAPEAKPRVPPDASLALANDAPASIASFDTPDLFPVLVEGSYYWAMSWHKNTGTAPGGASPGPYQVRNHIYPRVVLWNPWNVTLRMEPCMVMIQGNGRFEMWTDCIYPIGNDQMPLPNVQWIGTEGGRNPNFSDAGGVLASAGYNDPYMGSYLFSLPATDFRAGECLVFTAERAAEYERETLTKKTYALERNRLSCRVAPDPSRNYYVSNSEIDGGMDFYPINYWLAPVTYSWGQAGRQGIENQGDDCRVILKHLGTRRGITFDNFDDLPQIAVVSASLQYGAGREPRIAWSGNEKMVCEQTDPIQPRPTQIPNVRTREGVRLRWHWETPSNLLNSGALSKTPHFEDALLANWNPRAAYATRTPWDNVGGSMPVAGSAGGPWFFGAYTRDLYDQSVSWQDQMPFVGSDGRCHGNPFGIPQEGKERIILFDVPREGAGVISLGQLQHVKLSQFVWHPSYAIGHSLADPRVASGPASGLDRTAPLFADNGEASVGGFDRKAIGWSVDNQRGGGPDAWAAQARALFQNLPETETLVYDLSFEANQGLWDDFFLSTGDEARKRAFLTDPVSSPLPNGRIRPASGVGRPGGVEELTDFHRAAACLSIDGAFNVNSTRVEAWKAVLGATRRVGGGSGAVFPRVLDAPGGEWTSGQDVDDEEAWCGTRRLKDEEIDRLAREIVKQVRLRGPFLSLADFVNRRLANDETGRCGALQAAINAAGLNTAFDEAYRLNNRKPLPDLRHPDNITDATRLEQTLKPASKVWGLPGYFTQGDLLQPLGPMLSARSDTFVIRTCGEALDPAGQVRARAWCEAVVQRTPRPVHPDASGINPRQTEGGVDFGRRFVVKSFRWLRREEI